MDVFDEAALEEHRELWGEDAPPRGLVQWRFAPKAVDGMQTLEVDSNRLDPPGLKITQSTLGLVLDPDELEDYLDAHKVGTLDIPQYYSEFDDWGDREGVHAGVEIELEDGGTQTIRRTLLEASLRILNDHGRYSVSEYTLHDCHPYPAVLEREGGGAITIAPSVKDDD